jgi:hypothetical protein
MRENNSIFNQIPSDYGIAGGIAHLSALFRKERIIESSK